MKHIEYYESNDGTKFNDKIDCIEYELINSYHNTKGLVIKDFKGNTINDIYDQMLSDAEIILIKDEQGLEILNLLAEYYRYEQLPYKIGCYWWGYREQRWLSYDEIENSYFYYKNIKDELKNLIQSEEVEK